jgi:single-strand DNA-binding protein
MASFNKTILMGNLTFDPQAKNLPSGTMVVEFGVATNRRYKTANGEDKEEVCFVDCTAFGKQAEVINQYFTKGKPIFLEGRLKYETWDDKQGGGKRSKLTVVVENFQFVGKAGDDADSKDQPEREPRRQQHRGPLDGGNAPLMEKKWPGKTKRTEPVAAPFGDKSEFDPDSIPF